MWAGLIVGVAWAVYHGRASIVLKVSGQVGYCTVTRAIHSVSRKLVQKLR